MCIIHLISHTPCGHLTTSLPRSLAGHCKALDNALRYYHSQPERPPLPGGMVMPSVCTPVHGESSALRFWPVSWGCGQSEDAPCRMGWGGIYHPWVLGEAQRARVIWERESMARSGHVSANVNSNLRRNSVTSIALERAPSPFTPYSNPTPTSPNSNGFGNSSNINLPEAQFWGWGWWTDPLTGEIAPPPAVAAITTTAVPPLVATATREKSSVRERERKVRMIWPGRCIVDGDVGGVCCG